MNAYAKLKSVTIYSRRQWQLAPHRPAEETKDKDRKRKRVTKVVAETLRKKKKDRGKKRVRTTTNTPPPNSLTQVREWPSSVQPQVNVGDQFDLEQLLSSSSMPRNYLITSNQFQVWF